MARQRQDMEWQPVSSTCLSAARWRKVGMVPRMEVEFLESGRRYYYPNVSLDLFAQFMAAPSQGVFYNREIKSSFVGYPL